VVELCRQVGITGTTLYKWQKSAPQAPHEQFEVWFDRQENVYDFS
jgi:transposase-like protein